MKPRAGSEITEVILQAEKFLFQHLDDRSCIEYRIVVKKKPDNSIEKRLSCKHDNENETEVVLL